MKLNKSKKNSIKARLNYFDFIKETYIDELFSEIRISDFDHVILEPHKEKEMPKHPVGKDLIFRLKDVKKEGYLWWKKQVAYYEFVSKV